MSRNAKPSENKVHAPKAEVRGQKSKHRKGGDKARKLAPQRRLEATLGKFTSVSAELTDAKRNDEDRIKRQVSMGLKKPLSREEYEATINRPRNKQVNPLKIAKLLMPNSF